MANSFPAKKRNRSRRNRNATPQHPPMLEETAAAQPIDDTVHPISDHQDATPPAAVVAQAAPPPTHSLGQEVPMAAVYTDVVHFLRVLVVNSWLIILIAAIGTAATYFYISRQPKIYESTSTVMIVPQSGEITRTQLDLIDVLNANLVGNYVQILRSRRIRDQAFSDLQAKHTLDDLMEAEIDISPIANSTMMTVTARATDPTLAMDLVNQLVLETITQSPAQYADVFPIEVLDEADLPEDSVAPNVKMTILLGAAGSSAVGVALAFLLDGFSQFRRKRKQLLR